jgi:hypothetical protein
VPAFTVQPEIEYDSAVLRSASAGQVGAQPHRAALQPVPHVAGTPIPAERCVQHVAVLTHVNRQAAAAAAAARVARSTTKRGARGAQADRVANHQAALGPVWRRWRRSADSLGTRPVAHGSRSNSSLQAQSRERNGSCCGAEHLSARCCAASSARGWQCRHIPVEGYTYIYPQYTGIYVYLHNAATV